jgi:acyl carrier protein
MTVGEDRTVHDAVVAYIRENFLYARPEYALRDDARLLDDGIVDSMGAVELVAFLQDRFDIVVPDDEITEDNFGTIAAIAGFVTRKRRSAA